MSEKYPRELWDNPAFHKGREWGRMEQSEQDVRGIATEAIRLIKLDERKRAFLIFQKHIGQLIGQSRQGTEIDLTPMFNELMEKTNDMHKLR